MTYMREQYAADVQLVQSVAGIDNGRALPVEARASMRVKGIDGCSLRLAIAPTDAMESRGTLRNCSKSP